MFTLPNLISITRIPLAFCFFQDNPFYRSLAIIAALITDGLDGYLARRYNLSSSLGTLLDPFTDKFFVIMAGWVMIAEGRLNLLEVCALISRDFSLLIFGCYLLAKGELGKYRFRAIWCGKITTVLQLAVLFGLVWGMTIPPQIFAVFLMLGIFALVELYMGAKPEASLFKKP